SAADVTRDASPSGRRNGNCQSGRSFDKSTSAAGVSAFVFDTGSGESATGGGGANVTHVTTETPAATLTITTAVAARRA
ncbi:MAG: hypothetical protein AAGK78_15010, partial [Planctomycetota bacterium]